MLTQDTIAPLWISPWARASHIPHAVILVFLVAAAYAQGVAIPIFPLKGCLEEQLILEEVRKLF